MRNKIIYYYLTVCARVCRRYSTRVLCMSAFHDSNAQHWLHFVPIYSTYMRYAIKKKLKIKNNNNIVWAFREQKLAIACSTQSALRKRVHLQRAFVWREIGYRDGYIIIL